ncbi:MAG: hypothetical protein ACREMV_14995 [Gemmatimonadales bacterium]
MVPQDFYVFPDDLYRLASASDPKLTRVRPKRDADLVEQNGVVIVLANNRGISLYTRSGVIQERLTRWAWRIRKGTILPQRLKLHRDRPEHYMICPIVTMPLSEYTGLLEQLVLHCERVFKVASVV